jgi:hypothetical protein
MTGTEPIRIVAVVSKDGRSISLITNAGILSTTVDRIQVDDTGYNNTLTQIGGDFSEEEIITLREMIAWFKEMKKT